MHKHEAEKQFEKHLRENERLIYKVCRLYTYTEVDRQDLFQEIVIQLWKAYPKFRADSKFSTWSYRVVINTAIIGLRKQKDFIVSYEPASLPQHSNGDARLEEDQLQALYKAIEHLNRVEKAIVMLCMEDKSYEEMEEILGIALISFQYFVSRTVSQQKFGRHIAHLKELVKLIG